MFILNRGTKEIDFEGYSTILEAVERALLGRHISSPTMVPDNDIPISRYLSMREDVKNEQNQFLSFIPGKEGVSHPVIEEFKRQLDIRLNGSSLSASSDSISSGPESGPSSETKSPRAG